MYPKYKSPKNYFKKSNGNCIIFDFPVGVAAASNHQSHSKYHIGRKHNSMKRNPNRLMRYKKEKNIHIRIEAEARPRLSADPLSPSLSIGPNPFYQNLSYLFFNPYQLTWGVNWSPVTISVSCRSEAKLQEAKGESRDNSTWACRFLEFLKPWLARLVSLPLPPPLTSSDATLVSYLDPHDFQKH